MAFPKYLNFFVLFMVVHTIIAFGFFFRTELQLGYLGESVLQDGYSLVQEATGNVILRYFHLIAIAYALASVIKNKTNMLALILGYGMGLAFVIFLGGYNLIAGSLMELRMAGGYLDPNIFGLSGLVAVFFGVFGYSIAQVSRISRLFFVIMVVFGIATIIYSSSRGSALGLAVGMITLLTTLGRPSKVISYSLAFIAIMAFIVTIIPDEIMITMVERIDPGRIQFDRGAHRLDIWLDYLYAMPDYFFWGTGLSRAIEAIRYSGTFKVANTHNMYFQIFVELGIGGLLLFILTLIKITDNIIRISFFELKSARPHMLALFFAWMTNSFFLNTLNLRDTWIVIALVISCIKIDKENKIENSAY